MGKTKANQRWLMEHFSDNYVKLAQKEGYRSRASFKLIEINNKEHLLKSGFCVVDLGAAPGGWSQVAKKIVGHNGTIIATDILDMTPIPNIDFVKGDFTKLVVFNSIVNRTGGKLIDCVISDMAPNMSGHYSVDQPRSIYLAELALEFAEKTLKNGGNLLVKLFQGAGFDLFLKNLRLLFKWVKSCKPPSSRDRSKEVYLLGQHYLNS